jgi:hypothetical protein
METVIEYKGKLYFFKKDCDILSDDLFIDKCWFIIKNLGVKDIHALADCWISCKTYGVEYSKDVMEKIAACETVLAQ